MLAPAEHALAMQLAAPTGASPGSIWGLSSDVTTHVLDLWVQQCLARFGLETHPDKTLERNLELIRSTIDGLDRRAKELAERFKPDAKW